MNKYNILNLVAVLTTALTCIAVAITFCFIGLNTADFLPYVTTEGTDGKSVAVSQIEELDGLHTLRYANYTPNEFLLPGIDIQGEVIDLTQFTQFAERGTLQFVFLNLDPYDENFTEKSNALAPFLGSDNYWHFTLCLPAFAGACNIYTGLDLTSRAGDISNYNFIEYSNYQSTTQTHRSESVPLSVDLQFYSQRHAMSPDLSIRATVVTIHYEAANNKTVQFSSLPLVGENSAVQTTVNRDDLFLLIGSMLSAAAFLLFVFAAILKRTFDFLPQTFLALGAFGFFYFRYLLFGICTFPYAAFALREFFAALIPFSAVCSLREHIKKFPIWIVFAGLALLPCIFSPLSAPINAASFFAIFSAIAETFTAALLFVLILFAIIHSKDPKKLLIPTAATVFTVTFTFSPDFLLQIYSSSAWLGMVLIAATAALGVLFFVQLERKNIYLTSNLQGEVLRQTDELRSMLQDKDKLLRYMSHDLKKPVVSIWRSFSLLKRDTLDPEQCKLIDDIEYKLRGINESLADLQRYAKQNYAAEISAPIDADEIVHYIYESLEPDCTAQGIHLHCESFHCMVFAKRNMLISVLNNLLFNALEHAHCSTIKILTEQTLKFCKISVIDDGIGLTPDTDPFRPYYSETAADGNLGLGLYLCRQFMHAMGGELTYERIAKKSIFTASVPLAKK